MNVGPVVAVFILAAGIAFLLGLFLGKHADPRRQVDFLVSQSDTIMRQIAEFRNAYTAELPTAKVRADFIHAAISDAWADLRKMKTAIDDTHSRVCAEGLAVREDIVKTFSSGAVAAALLAQLNTPTQRECPTCHATGHVLGETPLQTSMRVAWTSSSGELAKAKRA